MGIYFLKEELWISRLVELRRLRTALCKKIQLRKAMKSLINNISSDRKNKKNIEKKVSKGLGKITQIMNLLESITFGQHYIEIITQGIYVYQRNTE